MKTLNSKINKWINGIIPNTVSITKVVGVIGITLASFNMNATNESDKLLSPEQMIEQKLKFPSLTQPIHSTEKVKIVFTTDDNGNVNYCLAKTQNAELKSALENQFKKIQLTNTKSNVTYSIVINLKTL